MPEYDCSKANDRQRIIDNASWLTGRDVRLITLSGLISGEASALYPQVCALVIPADVNPHMLGRDFSSDVLFSANYTDTRRDPLQRIGVQEQDMVDEAVKLLRRDIERHMGNVIQCDAHGMFHIQRPHLRPEWSEGLPTDEQPAWVPRKNTRISQNGRFNDFTDDDDDSGMDIIQLASQRADKALREDLRAVAHEVGAEERQRTAELQRTKNGESSRPRTKLRKAIEPTKVDTAKRRKVRKT